MKHILVILSALVINVSLRADEEKIAIDKLPKGILESVKKRFPKAEIIEAAKETEGTKVEYEVTIKDGETKIDVMLTPEGKITLIEKVIAGKDLPKVVTDTVEAKYPKYTLKLSEEITKVNDGKETLGYYEVIIVTADKKTLELQIDDKGKILMTEDKTNKKK